MDTKNFQHLQVVQQGLQNISLQKQQIKSQITEIDSALKELKETSKVYQIVGKIMISSESKEVTKDLEEKKEVLNVRIKNFTKQEEKLKKDLEETQKSLLKEIKTNGSSG